MAFGIINTTIYGEDMNISGLEEIRGEIGYEEIKLTMPLWEIIVTVVCLTSIIIFTIVGNILVILSVFTYRPLRIVQNFFIVSLAVADLMVAVFVLPFNVAYSIIGKWVFGIHLCEMWLTCDVLCCTASILNLCAIALDRYWAITDPINYAQKRTLHRVLVMITLVWIVSVVICLPPLFGWNDWPEVFTEDTPCMLTQEKGFIIYSSIGSFYLPLLIMALVYIKIYLATKKRLRDRAKAACKMNQLNPNKNKKYRDVDSDMSENGHSGLSGQSGQSGHSGSGGSGHSDAGMKNLIKKTRKKNNNKSPQTVHETSLTENEPSTPGDEPSPAEEFQSDLQNHERQALNYLHSSPNRSKQPDVVIIKPPVTSHIHQFIEEKQRISLSKERRAARILGIIMGVFMICWLPFFIMYVILPFCDSCTIPDEKFINFITWLGYVNSSLNPVIYTIFNLDFRRAFTKILK
ncbi:unnamed protein product, partial [Meganyctiphanes norvegica]